MIKTVSLTLIALAGLVSVEAAPPNLKQCGGAYYDPSQYTCYNTNGGLCPIMNGVPTLLCGQMTCYDKHMYR